MLAGLPLVLNARIEEVFPHILSKQLKLVASFNTDARYASRLLVKGNEGDTKQTNAGILVSGESNHFYILLQRFVRDIY
jgi:hypothetical protein